MRQKQRIVSVRPIPESTPLDANELLTGLWIGAKPPRGPAVHNAGFSLCVFCANEIQPSHPGRYPGVSILNAPLRDAEPNDKERMIAIGAGKFVSNWIKTGKGRVLVTCHMGLNRSALVCALAWKMLQPKRTMKMIIHDIRERRDPYALCNEDFVKFLLEFDSYGPAFSYYVNPVIT